MELKTAERCWSHLTQKIKWTFWPSQYTMALLRHIPAHMSMQQVSEISPGSSFQTIAIGKCYKSRCFSSREPVVKRVPVHHCPGMGLGPGGPKWGVLAPWGPRYPAVRSGLQPQLTPQPCQGFILLPQVALHGSPALSWRYGELQGWGGVLSGSHKLNPY